jgi:hypothetical protein
MDIEVIITRDGTLAVLARGAGAFAEAAAQVVQAVLQQLTAAAIPLAHVSAVERHQHADTDDTVVHTQRHTHRA